MKKKKQKEPVWTPYKEGYKVNMTTSELNAWQKRTGKRSNPFGF